MFINEQEFNNDEFNVERAKLLGSLLTFTHIFYKIRTGREYEISDPVGRESHHKIISRELSKCIELQTQRLMINIEPGSGKSELLKYFVAWSMARHPDSNFLYISYSHELAAEHTRGIREIMSLPHYKKWFDVEISQDSSAKDNFKTNFGGTVYASGSKGSITGRNAGLPVDDRFSGAVIIDDIHKPDEVFSDAMREDVVNNYFRTIIHRPRSPVVPIIFVGQRLHENDLPAQLLAGKDGHDWRKVILKSIDEAGNVLHPKVHPREYLDRLKKVSPYEYAAQYQQDPQPAGGGIFKPEWFPLLDNNPNNIIATFITADTAETDNSWNDATVFSFWGLYKIANPAYETDVYALHWIDCRELRIEPAYLENEFLAFYADCMRYPIKPLYAAIEKKSTGVTLVSVLGKIQGVNVIEIDRNSSSGNKVARFFNIQQYVAKKLISLNKFDKHTNMCIEHCRKITGNNTHAHDDIADTMYDAIKMALIDKLIIAVSPADKTSTYGINNIASYHNNLISKRRSALW